MTDLDEFNLARTLQRSDHAVDAVTWVPVDPSNTPRVQAVNNEIAKGPLIIYRIGFCCWGIPPATRSL
jgi:hypothetical protein